MSNLNFIEYHKAFEDVYVILALIDDTFKHNYFTTKLIVLVIIYIK